MSKKAEIDIAVDKLISNGMDEGMARKNLLECDRYFIEKLANILR